jgi:hypothetical protein
MDSNYVFLCGVMWCKFGQKDAGKELLRAADSGDPDMKALAWAMFAKGVRRLKELEKRMQPLSHPDTAPSGAPATRAPIASASETMPASL